jgi:hypothetical protein
VTDHDAAFLWETEALRSSPQRIAELEADGTAATGTWLTLREASRETGIPVETLRKWARRATIPSYLSPTDRGTTIRMVELDGIRERAEELGRHIDGPPLREPAGETTGTSPATDQSPAPSDAAATTAPAGTMIVPIDAWNKMLNQLGNLHEAGRQLAEARERAVKAETEASFLRERLAELRRTQPAPDPIAPERTAPPPAPPVQSEPEKVWQFLWRRMRGG